MNKPHKQTHQNTQLHWYFMLTYCDVLFSYGAGIAVSYCYVRSTFLGQLQLQLLNCCSDVTFEDYGL
jgi:hypothetical protein